MPGSRLAVACAVVTVVGLVLPSPAASAVPAGPGATTAPTTVLPPPTTQSVAPPHLSDVDGRFVAEVRAEVGSAQQGYDLALASKASADNAVAADSAQLDQAVRQLATLAKDQQDAAANVATAHDRLRNFAVAVYVTGGAGTPMASMLSADSIGDFSRRRAIFGAVVRQSTSDLATYAAAKKRAAGATLRSLRSVEDARARKEASARGELTAADVLQRAAARIASRRALLTLATDALAVGGTDVPRMMLDAYQRAALAVQARGCRLAWWGLAGVGKVESDHGRHDDGSLLANGTVVPPILGPALDGTNGTVATPAVDRGKFTGDPTWDHAVGPMQFISTTWRTWGTDGNGDGIADPNNAYDAAMSTARYLCAASTDLDTPAGLRVAYFSYNHSDAYVAEALAVAAGYEAADASGTLPTLSPVPLYSAPPALAPK